MPFWKSHQWLSQSSLLATHAQNHRNQARQDNTFPSSAVVRPEANLARLWLDDTSHQCRTPRDEPPSPQCSPMGDTPPPTETTDGTARNSTPVSIGIGAFWRNRYQIISCVIRNGDDSCARSSPHPRFSMANTATTRPSPLHKHKPSQSKRQRMIRRHRGVSPPRTLRDGQVSDTI